MCCKNIHILEIKLLICLLFDYPLESDIKLELLILNLFGKNQVQLQKTSHGIKIQLWQSHPWNRRQMTQIQKDQKRLAVMVISLKLVESSLVMPMGADPKMLPCVILTFQAKRSLSSGFLWSVLQPTTFHSLRGFTHV